MQTVHPLHAGAARPIPSPVLAPQQRVAASRIRARQQKIFRTALLLLVSATLICVLLMWRTDNARLASWQQVLDHPVTAIQSRIDALGFLPGSLSETEAAGIQSYAAAGSDEQHFAMNSGQPTIIAVSDRIPLLLRANGRFVIIYDAGKVHTEWMTNRQFEAAVREQADRIRAYERRLPPPELPR